MTAELKPSSLSHLLSPWPVLLGVAFSFITCCAAGRVLSRMDCYPQFTRFHYCLSPQTLYYPTASQVRTIPRSHPGQEKIVVIIGGNSVLQGYGQRGEHVWTNKLQTELGDEYEVVNLAIPGAYPWEFGGTAVEMLAQRHPRLIFVSYAPCMSYTYWPVDGYILKYFFWDAYRKGLLPHDERREERLRTLLEASKSDLAFCELQKRMRLDSVLYFHDAWTALAYQQFSTVWTPSPPTPFTRPRKRCPDPDPGPPPMDRRYPPDQDVARLVYIRNSILRPAPELLTRAAQVRAGSPGTVTNLERSLDALPLNLRRLTLMLMVHESPHYVGRLTPAEQATYASLFAATAVLVESKQCSTREIGKDYTNEDFIDRGHLSEEGGVKMALDVAPAVRRLAKRLGFTRTSDGGSPSSIREAVSHKAHP